jgi:hypothetical protein
LRRRWGEVNGIREWAAKETGRPFVIKLSEGAVAGARHADQSRGAGRDELDHDIHQGSTIGPKNNSDVSYFDDPRFNRKLKAAAKLSGAVRYRAYSRLALDLERDLVPAAPFATDVSRDFFSARIGCQIYQPAYGIDLAALCLRK